MQTNARRIGAALVIIGLACAGAISGRAEMAPSTLTAADTGRSTSDETLFFQTQTPFQHLASYRLLGASIQNAKGQVIGDIEDLILSTDNRIIGIIMGVGGALGFGEKKIAVRMSALKIQTGGKTPRIVLNASPAAIKAAPAYRQKNPKKSLIQLGAEATKKVLKKAAEKTSETVAKAKEATRKAVEPVKPAPPTAKN